MITTYLFDLDDTLIDTSVYAKIYDQIINHITKELGITQEELDKKAQDLGLKKNKAGKWDSGDLSREFKFLDFYYELLKEQIDKEKIDVNIAKIFGTLKEKGKTIGIVSNSMQRTINLFIEKFDLEKYIDFVFSSQDTGYRKSDKNYWNILIEKKNIDPGNTLVLGDDLLDDIQIPQQLGFQTFHLSSPKLWPKVLDFS